MITLTGRGLACVPGCDRSGEGAGAAARRAPSRTSPRASTSPNTTTATGALEAVARRPERARIWSVTHLTVCVHRLECRRRLCHERRRLCHEIPPAPAEGSHERPVNRRRGAAAGQAGGEDEEDPGEDRDQEAGHEQPAWKDEREAGQRSGAHISPFCRHLLGGLPADVTPTGRRRLYASALISRSPLTSLPLIRQFVDNRPQRCRPMRPLPSM